MGLPLLGLLAYDVLIVIAYKHGYLQWAALEEIPLSLFGSAIGVILAFRNSTSYARWWEARILWGSIVNNCRSWARLVTTTLRSGDKAVSGEIEQMRRKMVYYQIAWVHSLRQHLRRLDPLSDVSSLLTTEEIDALRDQKNVPVAIQQWQRHTAEGCAGPWLARSGAVACDESEPRRSGRCAGGGGKNQKHRCRGGMTIFPGLRAHVLLPASGVAMVSEPGLVYASRIDAGGIYLPGAR